MFWDLLAGMNTGKDTEAVKLKVNDTNLTVSANTWPGDIYVADG